MSRCCRFLPTQEFNFGGTIQFSRAGTISSLRDIKMAGGRKSLMLTSILMISLLSFFHLTILKLYDSLRNEINDSCLQLTLSFTFHGVQDQIFFPFFFNLALFTSNKLRINFSQTTSLDEVQHFSFLALKMKGLRGPIECPTNVNGSRAGGTDTCRKLMSQGKRRNVFFSFYNLL